MSPAGCCLCFLERRLQERRYLVARCSARSSRTSPCCTMRHSASFLSPFSPSSSVRRFGYLTSRWSRGGGNELLLDPRDRLGEQGSHVLEPGCRIVVVAHQAVIVRLRFRALIDDLAQELHRRPPMVEPAGDLHLCNFHRAIDVPRRRARGARAITGALPDGGMAGNVYMKRRPGGATTA